MTTDPTGRHGTALVRRPGDRLAEGIVTHIARVPVDVALARHQHAAYVAALDSNGWRTYEVPPADDCPDSVFVEDTVVIFDESPGISPGIAVLARPGAARRRPEVEAVGTAVRRLGLVTVPIEPPGTLDGGDVLQVGTTVYVGRGGRTNAEGVRQLRRYAAGTGRTVVAVPLARVLHLKSAVTALPDGTFLAGPDLIDDALFPSVRRVEEEPGAHVVVLDADRVLIAASASRTAEMIAELGFTPVVVDIGEFEKLEGCVTCLSVLIPGVVPTGREPSGAQPSQPGRTRPDS